MTSLRPHHHHRHTFGVYAPTVRAGCDRASLYQSRAEPFVSATAPHVIAQLRTAARLNRAKYRFLFGLVQTHTRGIGVGRRTMRCDGCRTSWAAQVLPEQRASSRRDLHPAQDNEKWVQTPRLRLAAAEGHPAPSVAPYLQIHESCRGAGAFWIYWVRMGQPGRAHIIILILLIPILVGDIRTR